MSSKQGRRNKTRQSSKQRGNVSSASERNFLHFCIVSEHSDTAREVLSSCETPGYLPPRQHRQHQCCPQHTRHLVHQLEIVQYAGRCPWMLTAIESFVIKAGPPQQNSAVVQGNTATSLQQAKGTCRTSVSAANTQIQPKESKAHNGKVRPAKLVAKCS